MTSKILKREQLDEKMGLEEQIQQNVVAEMPLMPSSKVISAEARQMSDEARAIIGQAQEEAKKIKTQAHELYKKIEAEMAKAKEAGFRKGEEEGKANVTELLTEAAALKEKMFADVEGDALRLIYDIAEKVLGVELTQKESAIIDMIRQALHASVGQRITVLVSSQDYESVKNQQQLLVQAIESSRSLQIKMDERVKPHGCMIETEIGTIDAQLDTQLSAIRKGFGLE